MRIPMTMIAASIVIIVVAALAVTLHHGTGSSPSSQNGTTPIQQPSAGTRIASFGQVSVQVPASLPTRHSLCGGSVAQEVVADAGAVSLCPVATNVLASRPGIVVWFSTAREYSPYSEIATSPAEIGGYAARRGYATGEPGLGAGISGAVSFPQADVTIGVTGPTRIAVDDILSTIVVARINPLGCPAKFDAITTTSPGPSDQLVTEDASNAVSCEYSTGLTAGLLIGSYILNPAQTNQLAAALNALVPDPCNCSHGGTPAPGYDEVLYFRYPDDSTLMVTGHVGNNLDTYTNQTRTVANYSSSISQLLAQLTNQH
jgi:hypothetical protein